MLIFGGIWPLAQIVELVLSCVVERVGLRSEGLGFYSCILLMKMYSTRESASLSCCFFIASGVC